jgi:septum formation protein
LKIADFPSVVLASASPRRAELLCAAGIEFEVIVADVDERVRPGESPDAYVARLAVDKARAVAAKAEGRPVLAADTSVVVDGDILGKPLDAMDATRMLRRLSGREHQVLTGVCLTGATRMAALDQVCVETTMVAFAPLTDDEIAWYVASGEPMDKAGAYAIQGLASRFITRIDGSYANVVGLPIARVYAMLTLCAPR